MLRRASEPSRWAARARASGSRSTPKYRVAASVWPSSAWAWPPKPRVRSRIRAAGGRRRLSRTSWSRTGIWIGGPVHHAGLPEAPRRRQQNMTEAELFPNQIDERLASVAVRAPYRRSNKVTWHATIMSHNKIVAQLLNWVRVVILAYAQASAPASCPTGVDDQSPSA